MEVAPFDTDLPRSSFVEAIEPGAALEATDASIVVDSLLGASVATGLRDSRQAICITDANIDLPGPTISFVNEAYNDIFCCTADDVVGRSPRIGQGPLTNRKVLDRLRMHLAAGESVQAQAINYRLDRSSFRLRWSIDPLRRDGQVVGFLAMMRDVTVDDRMRRRLAALDTLMARGRVVSGMARRSRDEAVAEALSASLRPMVAEIGSAVVTIGSTSRATQIDDHVIDESPPTIFDVPIGTVGTVHVEVHPDADGLLDRLAINELSEHALWFVELGEPS